MVYTLPYYYLFDTFLMSDYIFLSKAATFIFFCFLDLS